MEKYVSKYDKECMKMAMLKHEEIFREQVYELHRLYQIQKMLMKNMPTRHSKETSFNFQNINSQLVLDQASKVYDKTLNDGGRLEIEDELDVELTLGPSSNKRRKKPATQFNSDSSFSSSSSGSNQRNRSERTMGSITTHSWGLMELPGSSQPGLFGGSKNSSDVELRQERPKQQPPWLYQVLSLNMT